MTLIRVGVKEKKVNVKVIETGSAGKSAYQVWLDAGNTGTVSEFLQALAPTKTYNYNGTEMAINHQIGHRAMIQVLDETGSIYNADVQHLTLDIVQIKTNTPRQLTIIIK